MKIPAFTKTYGGNTVLRFPGADLEPGKIYAIIGANGSGKSTFAKALAGIIPADAPGRLVEPTVSVGYLPQKSYAFRMSLWRNLLLGSRDPQKAEGLMEVLRLHHLSRRRADRLSGGETARMALARLMMKSFDLVILDEPTAAMDMESCMGAEELTLSYVKETGCALILVTHSLQQANRTADEIWFFRNGELWESGGKEALLSQPQRPETEQFLRFYGG